MKIIQSSPCILHIHLFLNAQEAKSTDQGITAYCFSGITKLWCHANHASLNLPSPRHQAAEATGQLKGSQDLPNCWSCLGLSTHTGNQVCCCHLLHGRVCCLWPPLFPTVLWIPEIHPPSKRPPFYLAIQISGKKKKQTTIQSKLKGANPWRCMWSSIPTRAVMSSKTTAPGNLTISICIHARDMWPVLIKSADCESSTNSRQCQQDLSTFQLSQA